MTASAAAADPKTTPDSNAPPAGGGDDLFSKVIPQEYHDRAYLKDFLTMKNAPEAFSALFKKLDNAESLIGKRPTGVVIPAADAKPEEIEQFLSKLRPEKADDYEIKVREGDTPDPEFAKVLKQSFHEAGLTKFQASKVQEKFLAAVGAQRAEVAKAQKALDDEFMALSEKTFAADNEKKLARAKAMLTEHTPENLKAHIQKLDNNALVILAGVLNAVDEKYGLEDKINPSGSSANNAPADVASLREEARTIMASKEYTDTFHPQHDAAVAKLKVIYAEVAKKSGGK